MTRLLIFVLALLLSSGCAKKEESASAPTVSDFEKERAELTARIKSKSRALVQPGRTAPAAPAEGQGVEFSVVDKEYTYDPTGKRDPFRSFILTVEAERKDSRGPLEQFDLMQLKLVAVVWGSERARAVVSDPSGRGYIVREGTYMGKNEGRVIGIADNALVVRETYVDYFDETTTKDVTMRVRAEKAEKEGDLR